MQKEIKLVDEKRGIVRVTMADERWYIKAVMNEEGLPEVKSQPSSTWISHFYYTSPWLVKWIAEKGMDEAEAIKKAAGDKGSKVHKAIDMWLSGIEIKIDTKVKTETGEAELTAEENEIFQSFIGFYRMYKPTVVAHDYVNWGNGYSGTVDLKCIINGELGILDFKTSQQVYTDHKLQISSYKHADEDKDKIQKLWILQLGYRRNKDKFKLTEVDDKFHLFQNAMQTWKEERGDEQPKYIEYPLVYPTKEELDKTTVEASSSPVATRKPAKRAVATPTPKNG